MSGEDEIHMIMEREAGAPESVPALGVGFYSDAVPSPRKSKLAGRPIYEDCEHIKIVTPGDRNSEVNRPTKDGDSLRFPRAYALFKAKTAGLAIEGTPIEHWPQMTRAMALTFKASNIHTVEALAAVHDGNLEKLGHGMREWRSKAQAFLTVAKDAAAAQEYKADSDRKDAMIADLQRQIRELAERMEQPEKRGPGRPRKVHDDEAAA